MRFEKEQCNNYIQTREWQKVEKYNNKAKSTIKAIRRVMKL